MFSEVTVDSRRPSGRPRNRDRSYKSKQRRVQGACDVCKKRKSDSAEMPHNRCTHCTNLGLDCTHADIMKTLSSENGYVSALENRVEKMENLLSKDFSKQLENETDVEPLSIHNVETLPRNDADELTVLLNKLKINPEENRTSGLWDFQTRFAGLSQVPRPILPNKRKEYWEPPQWLLPVNEEGPQYTFPDPDLIPVLVDLYFTEVNCFRPVLHRPTFDRKVADGLHFVDHRFAATLLIVCSLGARHSEDSRVVFEGQTTRHSAGWKWYEQVRDPLINGEVT
ncbi:hypothetical protein B0H11DRAFT_2074759 [Mycena galericulata]|nr:hypothetical protein B0H11DRAFT_2074759 [Mycena galericulata]